jgi:hypothetical protein
MYSVDTSFARTRRALADKAAGKVQRGGRKPQVTPKARMPPSNKLEDVRSAAGTVVTKASTRAQSRIKSGLGAPPDSVVAFTKKNPAQALAIAGASGALLYATIKALSSSRD